MKTLGGILIVIVATVFELIGRFAHAIGSVAMSTAIMLIGLVSNRDLSK